MNRIELGSFWLPRGSSTLANHIDQAWWIVTIVAIVFGLIVYAGLIFVLVKFRRRGEGDVVSRRDDDFRLELLWTVIPTLVVIGLFWIGLQGFIDAHVAPGDAMEIRVTAAKWMWTFTYPTGYTTTGELRVPKGRPVKIVLSSKDVIHSFFIPEFRVKQDAVPGAYTTLWFEATRTGEALLECTEYCGSGHSDMLAKVTMMEPAAFDQWLDDASNEGKNIPPAEYGKMLFTRSGCIGCHSVTATPLPTAPSVRGVYGRKEKLVDGSFVAVDDNYVRESILVPTAKVVAGYNPVMPPFKGVLTDTQIDALIAYLKTLK